MKKLSKMERRGQNEGRCFPNRTCTALILTEYLNNNSKTCEAMKINIATPWKLCYVSLCVCCTTGRDLQQPWGLVWTRKPGPRQTVQVTEQGWVSAEGASKPRSAFSFSTYVRLRIYNLTAGRRIGVRVATKTKTQPCRTQTDMSLHKRHTLH